MATLNFRALVPVIDANIGVGHRHDRAHPCPDAPALLAEMHRHGVEQALVYHVQGETISAIEGNEQLSKWTGNHISLRHQWVCGPSEDSLTQLRQLHSDGLVETVRLHSAEESGTPFVDWVYGDLLSWLEAHHIPLWVSLADTPAVEVGNTLRHFPDLITVLVGAHYTHSMMIRPLLRLLPHTFIEMSRYENLGELETLIEDFGSKRFLYGSYFPRYAMGPMLFYLHHLHLTKEQLTELCCNNVQRLMGELT